MSCFACLLGGGRKASSKGKSKAAYSKRANDCPKVKPVEFMDMADAVHVMGGAADATPCVTSVVVRAVKKDPSDADPVAGEGSSSGYNSDGAGENALNPPARAAGSSVGRMSPKLKRSCSNIETARCAPERLGFDLPAAKSCSYGDLNTLPPAPGRSTTPVVAPDASPAASVRTSCSADRVMLKKRSSCGHVLPSRSRKLWWRLFLWSDRGLHRPTTMPPLPSAGAADTLCAATAAATADCKNKQVVVDEHPVRNQRDASPLDRVGAWLNSLGNASFHAVDDEGVTEHDGRPQCFDSEIVELPTTAGNKRQAQAKRRTAHGAAQPSSAFSAAAHLSGMGLKAVPVMAAFSSLRAVNLSGNFIVHISSGSLPKGLHSLDLSRNQIAVIEGLRELTRLRVLNLSYNRISRIGHGLSSCTGIRELYLGGNKISDVEGLHRLRKLAVLDVSANRVTTAKSLGQLVANYGSLRALNLAGNPVQANVGDDTLRRAVTGLLPRLQYLDRQAVRPQRAREAARDSVAQAALGNGGAGAGGSGGWSSRSRRPARRVVSQSPGAASAKRRGREREGSGTRRGSRSRSKTRAQSSASGARR